jgi:hypothetical protein
MGYLVVKAHLEYSAVKSPHAIPDYIAKHAGGLGYTTRTSAPLL